MPLTNPTELRAFLNQLGVHPKKGLSQNFLIDGNILRKIVAEAAIEVGDNVLEIGPGPGALTELLIAQGAHLFAVERDPLFAEALRRFPEVNVFAQDILKFDINCVPSPAKVVSNLPYHLTAPILSLLSPRRDLFSTLTLMVQEEVARRMTAQPKTKQYSSLTVFLHFYSTPTYCFKVSKHCFYPQPKVDSAVVKLVLKEPPCVPAELFFELVRSTFQQRRKMVKTTLGKEVGGILEELGESPESRPQDLSLAIFLELFNRLHRL